MLTGARCFVHLADNEYSHSTKLDGVWITHRDGKMIDNMWDAAAAVFDANPNVENLVVTVLEHGGWSLAYLRDKTIVGSANDAAVHSPAAQRFFDLLKTEGVRWEYLPEVWRGRDKVAA